MISNLLTQIENDEIVLPAIQRDFVWDEDKITMMFDSIMRSYPIGIILLWETYLNIKHRKFCGNYQTDSKYLFEDNSRNKRIKLVLDGQQRLQSLYLSLNGLLDGKLLFFDLLSGSKADDFNEVFFIFRFLTTDQANELNALANHHNSDSASAKEDNHCLFFAAKEILDSSPESRLRLKTEFTNKYSLSTEQSLRLELNMTKLIHAITNDPNILKVSTIDENKPKDSHDRKTESDILEAFVRINRQGISLSRSDLIFSMLKLNWKESAEELPDFISHINEGNNLNIDVDFVIRTLFTVSDLGSRFDVDLLRKYSNVQTVKANYEKACNSIKSLVDFLEDECKILNSSLIGSTLNLIPIVYYLFHTPDNLVPNSEINKLKKVLYIFSFTRPFSRYADSRIGKFIRDQLKPLLSKNNYSFPLSDSIWWVNYWEGYTVIDENLLQRNKSLTLHLLQGKQGTRVKYLKNAPELDHIFPKSILEDKGYEWNEINSLGNFWILAKTKNQNKSNKHPKEYFSDVEDVVLQRAFIDREMLDYRKFKSFIKWREAEILKKVKENIGVKNDEIDYLKLWGEKDDSSQ